MIQPFDLNLRHLRALVSVVSLRSLNRAAEAAGLSQPALTQGMAKLERQLGVLLFDRHSGGVEPTLAGEALAERVERAFVHLAAAVRRQGRAGLAQQVGRALALQLRRHRAEVHLDLER